MDFDEWIDRYRKNGRDDRGYAYPIVKAAFEAGAGHDDGRRSKMEAQDLGELRTVSNTLRDSHLEADDLIVGWVLIDGDLTRVAFTKHELRRPVDRAADNLEDLLTLGAKPPTHKELERVEEERDELKEKLEKLRARNWWQRLWDKE